MSNSGIINNFQDYLNLYNITAFNHKVAKSLQNVQDSLSDNENRIFLSNMVGMNTNQVGDSINPSLFKFYFFWNNEENINNASFLLRTYILSSENSPESNTNGVSNFRNVNFIVTYILSYFFSNIQYDTSGNATSFPPDLLNPEKNTPAVLNIKNFLQRNINSSSNNLLGCGNYHIPTISEMYDSYTPETNNGFIYYMCQDLYSKFQFKNNELEGEKLINNYRHVVSQNKFLLSYCGCFIPTPSFFHEVIGFGEEPGESPCDPLCYNNVVFKLYENNFTEDGKLEGGGNQKQCNAQICVIDNYSINSVNSNGKINFNQVCKGCGESNSGCLCFVDVSGGEIFEKISSGKNGMVSQENFLQNCPENSVCFEYNDGDIIPVDCNKINTPRTGQVFGTLTDGLTNFTSPEEIPQFFWFIMSIIFILLILFMYGIASYS